MKETCVSKSVPNESATANFEPTQKLVGVAPTQVLHQIGKEKKPDTDQKLA